MLKQAMTVMVLTFAACADPDTQDSTRSEPTSGESSVAVYEGDDGSRLEVTRQPNRVEITFIDHDGTEHVASFEPGDLRGAQEFLWEMRSPLLQTAAQLAPIRAGDADLWLIEVIDPSAI